MIFISGLFKKTAHLITLLICLFAGLTAAAVDSVTPPAESLLQLTDAAEATLQRQAIHAPASWISSWLADAPTLSTALLQSQTAGGSDEIELALTLPLKSPARAQLDDELLNNEQGLRASLLSYRRWFASGMIRDHVWAITLEQTRQQVLAEQLALYQRFLAKLQTINSGSELNVYHQYLYQQGLTELQLEVIHSEKQLLKAQQQLQQLTGQQTIPTQVREVEFTQSALSQHPRLRLLILQEQQLQLQRRANTAANAAWQITTRVKQVSTAGVDDKQIGVQLDVPLSFGQQISQLDHSNYQLNYQQWLDNYSDAQRDITQQQQTARVELQALKAQLILLSSNDTLRQQAKANLLLLLEYQEISPDIAQQRLQQLLQAELQLALLEVQVQQAISMLNQAAGVML